MRVIAVLCRDKKDAFELLPAVVNL